MGGEKKENGTQKENDDAANTQRGEPCRGVDMRHIPAESLDIVVCRQCRCLSARLDRDALLLPSTSSRYIGTDYSTTAVHA